MPGLRPLSTRGQLAALPWRDGPAGREVLLITTRGRRQWLVPKGKPMPGLTAWQAAAEEAWEEAGVRGDIETAPIGAFEHRKGSAFAGRRMRVDLYPLRVTIQSEVWPEAHERERRWVNIAVALRLVRSPGLRQLIAMFGQHPPTRRARFLSALRRLSGLRGAP
jgi:8-oxo-dGTP pyrophosphatase MutT (NUDIX family)